MSKVLSVHKLPSDVKARIDTFLRQSQYSEYVELADQLSKDGYNISKSALHRYGTRLKASDASAFFDNESPTLVMVVDLLTRETKTISSPAAFHEVVAAVEGLPAS